MVFVRPKIPPNRTEPKFRQNPDFRPKPNRTVRSYAILENWINEKFLLFCITVSYIRLMQRYTPEDIMESRIWCNTRNDCTVHIKKIRTKPENSKWKMHLISSWIILCNYLSMSKTGELSRKSQWFKSYTWSQW